MYELQDPSFWMRGSCTRTATNSWKKRKKIKQEFHESRWFICASVAGESLRVHGFPAKTVFKSSSNCLMHLTRRGLLFSGGVRDTTRRRTRVKDLTFTWKRRLLTSSTWFLLILPRTALWRQNSTEMTKQPGSVMKHSVPPCDTSGWIILRNRSWSGRLDESHVWFSLHH